MIEVVFSDSEKGAMKCGQRFTNVIGGASAIGIIGSEVGQTTQEEYDEALYEAKRRLEQEMRYGKPLGGRQEDVIGLSFALDIGDITSPVNGALRRGLITRMLDADPWSELLNMEDSINHYWGVCVSDLEKLMMRAKDGEPVRIWYSNAPYSMCGYYNTIYQLKNYKCRISAVKLPDCLQLGEQGVKSAVSWGNIRPGEFAYYLPLESEIPDSVQQTVIKEWEMLKSENAPLRIVLNGKLHSVEIDFYDYFIRKEIPEDTFKVGPLIGLVIGKNQLGISDWIIAQRIKSMIESGELKVIKKDQAFYGTTLKRA
jgi:hypothetical protein